MHIYIKLTKETSTYINIHLLKFDDKIYLTDTEINSA